MRKIRFCDMFILIVILDLRLVPIVNKSAVREFAWLCTCLIHISPQPLIHYSRMGCNSAYKEGLSWMYGWDYPKNPPKRCNYSYRSRLVNSYDHNCIQFSPILKFTSSSKRWKLDLSHVREILSWWIFIMSFILCFGNKRFTNPGLSHLSVRKSGTSIHVAITGSKKANI